MCQSITNQMSFIWWYMYLSRLSRGVSNGYSSGARGMTASMRSSSAPAIDKQGHTVSIPVLCSKCVTGIVYVAVWVEIEHYSVVYLARIAAFKAFEALQHGTSVKGGAHTWCVNVVSLPSLYDPLP